MEAFILASPLLKWVFISEPHFSALSLFVVGAVVALSKKTSSKTDKIWERLNKVELEQADQHRRMNTHAEHFDVHSANIKDAKEDAHNAKMLSYQVIKDLKKVYQDLNSL